jgi:hypothetical protein
MRLDADALRRAVPRFVCPLSTVQLYELGIVNIGTERILGLAR